MKNLKETSRVYSKVVSFTIQPLRYYCNVEDQILHNLNEGDMKKVAKIMDDFNEMNQYLRKLKDTQFSQEFPIYREMLLSIGESDEIIILCIHKCSFENYPL